eukprot:2009716-Pyramimonas_sp.AAC.1
MIPRPPKSPTRNEVSAGMCRAVNATAFASVAPNYLAAARASMRWSVRPQRCTSQHQTLIAIASTLHTTLRMGGWDDCASSGAVE